ncbi:DUF29 domain-containing protein [Roseomonas sp. GCM10028921]
MSDLYENDLERWAEHQVARLQEIARTSNADVDWENIFEELGALGRSERDAVESALIQLLSNLLKITAWPESTAVNYWRGEAAAARINARRKYRPSMRQHIEADFIGFYRDAISIVQAIGQIDGREALPVPETSPVTYEELLDPATDLQTLLRRFVQEGG